MTEQTTTDLTLPSGNTISAETWNAITEAGDWRGILDPRMYGAADQEHMDALLPARGVEHMFQPFVCLTPRPDGQFDVDIDWSDAYVGENTEDGWDDLGNGEAACAAMDAWKVTQPAAWIIPAADAATSPAGPPTAHAASSDADGDTLDDVAEREGWDEDTLLAVIRDYVDTVGLSDALTAYAKSRTA